MMLGTPHPAFKADLAPKEDGGEQGAWGVFAYGNPEPVVLCVSTDYGRNQIRAEAIARLLNAIEPIEGYAVGRM